MNNWESSADLMAEVEAIGCDGEVLAVGVHVGDEGQVERARGVLLAAQQVHCPLRRTPLLVPQLLLQPSLPVPSPLLVLPATPRRGTCHSTLTARHMSAVTWEEHTPR